MMPHGTRGYMRSFARKYFLTTACVIEAEVSGKDADNMNTSGWSTVATTKCRILPAGQGDTERAEEFANQESIRVLKRIAVPDDITLDVGQRVTVAGEIYYIAALNIANTDTVFQQALVIQRAGADE